MNMRYTVCSSERGVSAVRPGLLCAWVTAASRRRSEVIWDNVTTIQNSSQEFISSWNNITFWWGSTDKASWLRLLDGGQTDGGVCSRNLIPRSLAPRRELLPEVRAYRSCVCSGICVCVCVCVCVCRFDLALKEAFINNMIMNTYRGTY